MGTKYTYKKPVVIPENIILPQCLIDWIDTNINQNKPNFKFNIYDAYYLLHLIIQLPMQNRNYAIEGKLQFDSNTEDSEDIFDKLTEQFTATISSKRARKYVTLYNKYLDYFVEHNLIGKKNYLKDHYCNGYYFKKPLSNDFKTLTLEKISKRDIVLHKNIHANINSIKTYKHLVKFFDPDYLKFDKTIVDEKLKIIFQNLTSKISKKISIAEKMHIAKKKMNVNYYSLENLKRGYIRFSRHKRKKKKISDNRLHTPLTNLKKDFRYALRYKNECLQSLDISSSQPFFLIALIELIKLNNKSSKYKRIERIVKYVYSNTLILQNLRKHLLTKDFQDEYEILKEFILSGNFYTKLGEIIDIPIDNGQFKIVEFQEYTKAQQIKTSKSGYTKNIYFPLTKKYDVMKLVVIKLLYSNGKKPDEIQKSFIKKFPKFWELLNIFKEDDYKKFPCLLQQFESDFIIDYSTKKISEKYPEMPLFTIHDSILTTESNFETLKTEFESLSIEYFPEGITPNIKIESYAPHYEKAAV